MMQGTAPSVLATELHRPAAPPAAPNASSRLLNLYVAAVFVLGVVGGGIAVSLGAPQGDYAVLLALLAFVAVAERISVPLYFDGRLSISFMGVAIAALLLGPAATVMASAVIALAGITSSSSVKKFAFNLGQHLLAGLMAVAAISLVARFTDESSPIVMLLSGGLVGVVLFAANTYGVSLAMSLASGRPIVETHREAFAWMLPHFAALGIVAGGLTTVYRSSGFFGVVIMAIPLVMSRYAMKQVIDKTRVNVLELERSHAEMQAMVDAVPDALFQLNSAGIVWALQ